MSTRIATVLSWPVNGEQLITDPYRPGYSRTDPTWVMRGTVGHSGILIDGKGHQYVDGSEGTNASKALARLVRFGEREGYHFWSSDATQAYQLVLPDVHLVMRTVLVLYNEPAVILIDKVVKSELPSTIQARFFGYNSDDQGHIQALDQGLYITRPHAHLLVSSFSLRGIRPVVDHLPLPNDIAQKYPFGDISTRQPSDHAFLISGLFPVAPGSSPPTVSINEKETGQYQVQFGGRQLALIKDAGNVPELIV